MTSTAIEVSHTEEGTPWINAAGVQDHGLNRAIDRVGREIANWVQSSRGSMPPSLFNRAAYVAPENPYSQMLTARSAVDNDDVVGGVADVTEALMFQGVKWEAESEEVADVFNQISRDLNLDAFVRQWHREDFTTSQAVIGMWWGSKQYKKRSKTDQGKRSKKTWTVHAPVAWTFLDPTKVVPLKPGMFGEERLAWHATTNEYATAVASQDNAFGDPLLREFTTGPVGITDKDEIAYLTSIGVDYRRLLGLNPDRVFRITRTKATYDRFAALRLKSVFALLDLKQQLIEADRVNLVGAANFILLVRQGTKEEPAEQEEIDNLKENFKVVAKLPVVVGDHRLQIDIITPDQEYVLNAEKYDTIDRRILSRALGSLSVASSGQRNESTLTIARGVARLLENRRHMMKRALEERLARAVVDHPLNAGLFDAEPNLTFTPRNVQLDADAEIVRAILALRTSNEISRESVLEYFGFDQAVEALRREFEAETYDDIFKTVVPFSSPQQGGQQQDPNAGPNGAPEPPQVSGARGGRPRGGGESPKSVDGQTGGRSANGNPSTGGN